MIDIDQIRRRIVAFWRDNWHGIETYAQLLTYVTFTAIGFGLGAMFVIRKLILENPQHLTEALARDTQEVIRISMLAAITVLVGCQLCLLCIHFGRSDR